MQKFDLFANKNSKYLICKFSDHIEAFDKVNVFFYGNDFVVVVAVAVAIVLYFEYVDFVVFAAGAVHTLFVYCVQQLLRLLLLLMMLLLMLLFLLANANLHTVMKTPSLLRVTLFRTHSIVLNTTILLMQKLDLEK